MKLAERITKHMKKHGLSYRKTGEQFGITGPAVRKLVNGATPKAKTAQSIAIALNVEDWRELYS